jgi:hypothetical protein
MAKRIFFLLALACAGVLLGASAVLAILNGNVALFAGCATMMLVVAAISLWAEARELGERPGGGLGPRSPYALRYMRAPRSRELAPAGAGRQPARRKAQGKRFMLCLAPNFAILSIGNQAF